MAISALTVIEEKIVTEAVKHATVHYPAAEEIFESVVWRIARQPDCGVLLEDASPFRRLVKTLSIRGANNPELLLRYYPEGEDALIVDWIKFSPYNEMNAVSPEAFIFHRSSPVSPGGHTT